MRSRAVALGRWTFIALFALAGTAVASLAVGQTTVDVALNVRYNVMGDPNSGGTWRLVAKASPTTFGISGLQVRLTSQSLVGSANAAGPIGKVNGTRDAGFSLFESMTVGNEEFVVVGQVARLVPLPSGQEQSIFYGVGTLANGAPDYPDKPAGSNSIGPAFSTLTNTARIPWATTLDSLNDPMWSTAVGLATGAFAPGSTPGIVSGTANVFTSLGTSASVGTIADVSGANFVSHGIRVVAGVGGDYNGNGIVDAADYAVWRDHQGEAYQLLNEGPDTPGQVTAEDYQYWKLNFGASAPGAGSGGTVGGPGAFPVPEPGALALLLGASGILLLRPKTRAFAQGFGPVKKEIFSVETA